MILIRVRVEYVPKVRCNFAPPGQNVTRKLLFGFALGEDSFQDIVHYDSGKLYYQCVIADKEIFEVPERELNISEDEQYCSED